MMVTCIKKTKNYSHLFLLFFVLTGKIVLEFMSAFLGSFFGMESTSLITIFFYIFAAFLMVFLVNKYKSFSCRSFIVLVLILLIYLLNYLFSTIQELYVATGMLILYFFYIPFSFLIVYEIDDWKDIFKYKVFSRLLCINLIIGLITAIISIFYSSSRMTNNSNYMAFSYTLLPIIAISTFYWGKTKDLKFLILITLNIVFLLFYGARMCFVLALAYFLLVFFLKLNNVLKGAFVFISIIIISLYIEAQSNPAFMGFVEELAEQTNSHILSEIMRGSFSNLGDRQIIYDACNSALSQMGLKINGLFYDRLILFQLFGPSVYSHNIVYEILLSFGWAFGTIFLVFLFIISLRAFHLSSKKGLGILFLGFFASFFCKFFVSSSFAIDQFFFIYLGLCLSFIKKKKISKYVDSHLYVNYCRHIA